MERKSVLIVLHCQKTVDYGLDAWGSVTGKVRDYSQSQCFYIDCEAHPGTDYSFRENKAVGV
jgi:hypothetical protein